MHCSNDKSQFSITISYCLAKTLISIFFFIYLIIVYTLFYENIRRLNINEILPFIDIFNLYNIASYALYFALRGALL